ncbi:MAG TPA: hypothetical protein QGG37_06255 [Chloroflexota bacterium]|nr:hypothetical protein [Chloroflexota bacterium]
MLQAQLACGVLGGLDGDEDGMGFGGLLDGTQSGLTDLLPRLNGSTGTVSLPFVTNIKYNLFRDLEVTSLFGTCDLGAGETPCSAAVWPTNWIPARSSATPI